MKTNLKKNQKFIPPIKNNFELKKFSDTEKNVDDEELLAVSKKIMERNKNVYAELAK